MITKKQFIKMNKARRRVFLAKDVLAQLDAGKYEPCSAYFTPIKMKNRRRIPSCTSLQSAQSIINDIKSCHVCAKGALACSYVANFNNYTYDEFTSNVDELEELQELFGYEVWTRIEHIFESPYKFNVEGRENHMRIIMQDIIDNKGELSPSEVIWGKTLK